MFEKFKNSEKIRNVSFDDHANFVGVATPSGFQIVDDSNGVVANLCDLNKNPNFPVFKQGCNLISTLGTSNILSLTPLMDENKIVYIWDKFSNNIMSLIEFDKPVVSFLMKPEYLIAATSKSVQVRKISDSSLVNKYDTIFNRDGIFDTPSLYSSNLIAFPAPDTGVVAIVDYTDISFTPRFIHAFKSSILFIKFNNNGRLLAVCGDDGRTISVYNYPSLNRIAQLKRGSTTRRINSISFDEHGTRLAVSDSSDTVHIFDLHQDSDDGFIKPLYKLKSPDSQPLWLSFSNKTLKLICISAYGNLYRIVFNQEEKAASFEQIGTKLKLK